MITAATPLSFEIASPEEARSRVVLRAYYRDIVGRYYGRPATETEIDMVLADEPSDDLQLPSGLFWLATEGPTVLGCAGLRLLPDAVGEVTRVFVVPEGRGRGIGARLLAEIEQAARDRGLARLQLDTRDDLVEARRLYARHGYREVPAFNDSPYAAHWFAKDLD
ncbi:GNAT family N-acetyltransferase [Micromonospora sp. NPDC003197]